MSKSLNSCSFSNELQNLISLLLPNPVLQASTGAPEKSQVGEYSTKRLTKSDHRVE
jgi:hypothetical protein